MVYALINESNIKSLMRELLNYLMSTDFEARADLTAKICWATEKYAPNPRWYLDTILRVMAIVRERARGRCSHCVLAVVDCTDRLESKFLRRRCPTRSI